MRRREYKKNSGLKNKKNLLNQFASATNMVAKDDEMKIHNNNQQNKQNRQLWNIHVLFIEFK